MSWHSGISRLPWWGQRRARPGARGRLRPGRLAPDDGTAVLRAPHGRVPQTEGRRPRLGPRGAYSRMVLVCKTAVMMVIIAQVTMPGRGRGAVRSRGRYGGVGDPGDGALHHPSAGQNLEGVGQASG